MGIGPSQDSIYRNVEFNHATSINMRSVSFNNKNHNKDSFLTRRTIHVDVSEKQKGQFPDLKQLRMDRMMGTGQSNTLDGLYRAFTNKDPSHPSPPSQYPQRVPAPEKKSENRP